jgi:hypothetical protein
METSGPTPGTSQTNAVTAPYGSDPDSGRQAPESTSRSLAPRTEFGNHPRHADAGIPRDDNRGDSTRLTKQNPAEPLQLAAAAVTDRLRGAEDDAGFAAAGHLRK